MVEIPPEVIAEVQAALDHEADAWVDAAARELRQDDDSSDEVSKLSESIAANFRLPTLAAAQVQLKHLAATDAPILAMTEVIARLSPADRERLGGIHGLDTDNFIFSPEQVAARILERQKGK